MRGKKSVVGKYARMTAADLRSETAEFDKEMVVTKSKPTVCSPTMPPARTAATWKASGGSKPASSVTGRAGEPPASTSSFASTCAVPEGASRFFRWCFSST